MSPSRRPLLSIALLLTSAASSGGCQSTLRHRDTPVLAADQVVDGLFRRPASATGPQLGDEQANPWVPLDALTAPTASERRRIMIRRIRDEVAARRSTLDRTDLERVLAAMDGMDREAFVPRRLRRGAYLPVSLQIGHGQTISDTYIVAVTLAAARIWPGARVLDIGTGSGFQAALMSRLGAKVTSVEIVPPLAREARRRLERLGYRRIDVRIGDGRLGFEPAAPYDVIVVAAGSDAVPPNLLRQLAPGGRLLIPIGPTPLQQHLLMITRDQQGGLRTCSMGPAVFVPLTGGSPPSPTPAVDAGSRPPCFERPVT